MGFIKTKYANQSDDWPDIQMFLQAYGDNTDGGLFSKRAASLTDDFYASVYEPILYKDAYQIMPLLLRPKSRGFLKLASNDPKDAILVYPNYFSHPQDIDILVSVCK